MSEFRPHERLRRAEEFRAVYDHRRSVSDGSLIVYGRPNGMGHSRLGLSVAKKKFPRAVRRNRVRRLLREAFRLSKADLPTGLDLILIPRHGGEYTLEGISGSLAGLVPTLAERLNREANKR